MDKILNTIYNAIDDKKGGNTRILDISAITTISDYFIITSGNNYNQVRAIADNVEEELLKKLASFEGKPCTICADMCPLPNPLSAIEMVEKEGTVRPIVKSGCVGCGACKVICPAYAIKILPVPAG